MCILVSYMILRHGEDRYWDLLTILAFFINALIRLRDQKVASGIILNSTT